MPRELEGPSRARHEDQDDGPLSPADGGGGGADPSVIASLQNRYRASDLVLADNDPVALWEDSKGIYDLTSAGTERPTYKTNGGDPYLLFDGVDDVLVNAVAPGGWIDFAGVIIVNILTTGVDFERVIDMGAVDLHTMAAGTMQLAVLGGGPARATPAAPTGFIAVYFERDAATGKIRINGAETTAAVGVNNTSSGIMVGEFVSGGFNKNMQIKEIMLFNDNLSAGDFSIAQSYVLEEYGLTL